MKPPPFDQLADSDAFEQLCFDLLDAEGFQNLVWRGPSADGGRDIEGLWRTTDPTGGVAVTRWYFECKWYSDTLSFGEIEPKLLSAATVRADYLLVMTSSRVKNTAMDQVAEWLRSRAFPFQIRYWTGRDLLRVAVRHRSVFQRHFPGLQPPAWGDAEASLRRLELMLGSANERLSWRILHPVQAVANQLALMPTDPKIQRAVRQLDFVSCMLRAHESFSSSDTKPATRACSIDDSIRAAAQWVTDQGARLDLVQLATASARLSRPFLMAVLFEILQNAALYCETGDAKVSLSANTTHWSLEIRNPSTEELPPVFPVPALRGAGARRRNGAGQGLGCWLAAQAATANGLRLWWNVDNGVWVTTLQGACV